MSRSPVFATFTEALNGVQTGLSGAEYNFVSACLRTLPCRRHYTVFVQQNIFRNVFTLPQLPVRCFRQVKRFAKDNEKKLIVNLSCYLNQGAVQLWLSLRLNWITTAILTIVTVFCVMQHHFGWAISVRLFCQIFHIVTFTVLRNHMNGEKG